jgi:hypothetical protein
MRPLDVDATELISTPSQTSAPHTSPTSLLEGFETAPNKQATVSTNKVGVGVMWGLGTGVLVILVGLLFWVMNLGSSTPSPTAPSGISVASVEGSLYDDALNTLNAQDLLVLRVYEKSEEVPEGVTRSIFAEIAFGIEDVIGAPGGAGDDPADLRDFEAMGQADAIVVPIRGDEDLGLVAQAAEGDRMDDPVTVALELAARAPGQRSLQRKLPPTRSCRIRGESRSHASASIQSTAASAWIRVQS